MTTALKHNRWGYINRKCRCLECRTDYRAYARTRNGHNHKPSFLASEVKRLNAELDAAEMNIEALWEENAMLHCRLQELEPHPHHNPELVNGYPPRNITGP